jgi:hypothetical protein
MNVLGITRVHAGNIHVVQIYTDQTTDGKPVSGQMVVTTSRINIIETGKSLNVSHEIQSGAHDRNDIHVPFPVK